MNKENCALKLVDEIILIYISSLNFIHTNSCTFSYNYVCLL